MDKKRVFQYEIGSRVKIITRFFFKCVFHIILAASRLIDVCMNPTYINK